MLRRLRNRLLAPLICRFKILVYLSSGQVVTIYCDEFNITWNKGGRPSNFHVEGGATATLPVYINPADIVAVQRRG